MNTNSVICRFIADHPADWEELLTRNCSIKVRREDSYAIFNYGFECDFADPVVQEARGIILDLNRLEVVCWPFRKFGNYNESYADRIDWDHARVLEKVDGSIIKLWYDHGRGKWQFSTNGTIRAEHASVDSVPGLTFGSVISRAENFGDLLFDALDRSCTYIFELVSPETQVVVKYSGTSLYHIGTRNNITGLESEEDIGIRKPASYPLDSLEQCLRAADELNKDSAGGVVSKEGFVVVDGNWNRIKVKSPDYLVLHRVRQTVSISKTECIRMLLENDSRQELLCDVNSALVPVFRYYEFRLEELKYQADQFAHLTRELYREYSGERRAVAGIIGKHRLAPIGFLSLDRKGTGRELVTSLPVEKIAKFIPDYEPEDFRTLFETA